MRAGSYAVGALSALAKLGYLSKVDVISAASGGAYAAGWYISQRATSDADDAELFLDCKDKPNCGVYQHHLADHGKLVNRRRVAFALLTDTLMFPVNLLVNGVFGWHENTTGHRRFYERALVSEFFTTPGTHRHIRYSFPDLGAASLSKHLPLLVVNTTVSIDDDSHHYAADLRNSIYELSPVRYGSDAFGYSSDQYQMDLPRAISVSGAAADLSVLASGNVQKTLFSALNLDLGYFIDNPMRFMRQSTDASGCVKYTAVDNAHFNARKWTFRAVPFPVYPFIPYWSKDKQGLRSYLSDGGHSENLAAFSLVRRLVRNIVIVDASGDANFLFDDYKQLQKAILQHLNANFEVPAIEAALKAETVDERRRIISAMPVMTGTVRYFPYPNEPNNERTLNIVYLKLSYDLAGEKTKYKDFPNIVAYRTKHAGVFPFQGLFDQAYSPDQYRAYRDLAYVSIVNDGQLIRSMAALP